MEFSIVKVYKGHVLDDEKKITFYELCTTCSISPDEIKEMINHGIIDHEGQSENEWRFSWNTAHRIQKARRLLYDLEVNMAGAALALHLLDKIESLEKRINKTNYKI